MMNMIDEGLVEQSEGVQLEADHGQRVARRVRRQCGAVPGRDVAAVGRDHGAAGATEL